MRDRLAVTPLQFRRVADATLVALTLIVLTGAAVRLTGSGLGCPNWPRCYGGPLPPLSTHALIEFGNRALSGLVGVLTGVTFVLAATRRPFRRDQVVDRGQRDGEGGEATAQRRNSGADTGNSRHRSHPREPTDARTHP